MYVAVYVPSPSSTSESSRTVVPSADVPLRPSANAWNTAPPRVIRDPYLSRARTVNDAGVPAPIGSDPTPAPETSHFCVSTDSASMTVPAYEEGNASALGPRPSPASRVRLA